MVDLRRKGFNTLLQLHTSIRQHRTERKQSPNRNDGKHKGLDTRQATKDKKDCPGQDEREETGRQARSSQQSPTRRKYPRPMEGKSRRTLVQISVRAHNRSVSSRTALWVDSPQAARRVRHRYCMFLVSVGKKSPMFPPPTVMGRKWWDLRSCGRSAAPL